MPSRSVRCVPSDAASISRATPSTYGAWPSCVAAYARDRTAPTRLNRVCMQAIAPNTERSVPEYSATIWMRSAELTGAGESVKVRQEGKANHYFHREPCGGIREGAVEASEAARVAGMIEHRKCYGPECRGFLICRRQYPQNRSGEGLRGSALSEESMDARTPLCRDSGGLRLAPAVVPGPLKKGGFPNRRCTGRSNLIRP